jgi:thioredoxin 1
MSEIQAISSPDVEAKVLQAQGPIAVNFYQATCPPCHVLEPRLERMAQEYRGRLPVYRVDIDRDLEVAERFGVMSIPTVLVVRAGKECGAPGRVDHRSAAPPGIRARAWGRRAVGGSPLGPQRRVRTRFGTEGCGYGDSPTGYPLPHAAPARHVSEANRAKRYSRLGNHGKFRGRSDLN